MGSSKQQLQKFRTKISVVGALLFVFLLLLVVYQSGQLFERYQGKARARLERLALVQSSNVDTALDLVEARLKGLASAYLYEGLDGLKDAASAMSDGPASYPALAVMDEDGALIDPLDDTGFWLRGGTDFSGEEFFVYHSFSGDKNGGVGNRASHVSVFTRDGKNILLSSVAIYDLSGKLRGVIVAAMRLEDLLATQAQEGSDNGASFALLASDNSFVGLDGFYNRPQGFDAAFRARVKDSAAVGPWPSLTDLDFEAAEDSYFLTLSRLQNHPLTLAAALSGQEYRAKWRSELWLDIALLLGVVLIGTATCRLVINAQKQKLRAQESERHALMANQSKSEFLARMSHELRTPLNAIIGFSEMILTGYFGHLNPKQNDRVRDINRCGNHLLSLINDVLDYSKVEAGKFDLKETEISLAQVIHEATSMVHDRASQKDIEIDILRDSDDINLYVDERKLKQILINLLNNAVKYTDEGGIIKVYTAVLADKSVQISVADNGVGIKQEDISTAMSVFGQVGDAAEVEGTGLGLPLSRMLANLHGASFELESTVEVGTTVTMIFPNYRLVC